MIDKSPAADRDRLDDAERALGRGEREAALSLLSDMAVFDGPTLDAMAAAFEGDLDAAREHCRRATRSRDLLVAA